MKNQMELYPLVHILWAGNRLVAVVITSKNPYSVGFESLQAGLKKPKYRSAATCELRRVCCVYHLRRLIAPLRYSCVMNYCTYGWKSKWCGMFFGPPVVTTSIDLHARDIDVAKTGLYHSGILGFLPLKGYFLCPDLWLGCPLALVWAVIVGPRQRCK